MVLETKYGEIGLDGTTVRPDNGEIVDLRGRVIREGKGKVSEELNGIRAAAEKILRLYREDKD